MIKSIVLLFPVLALSMNLAAQDTFSIVAVDTLTGEIGSAGASCIDETQITGGAIIISDVLPGRGAIHTQSYWNTVNQQNAHVRMEEGLSPQEIVDWLVAHDAQNNPAVRQYGIVDFDSAGHPRAAGFTGANCLNYKNHITGPNYSIQGNILLGQQILDSMEAGFLTTEGPLAEKLMAALQGANVVGADTRCTQNGTSSLSAFIRVAHPWDVEGSFYCDLNVPSLPDGMEPIDSLQTLFDEWLQVIVGIPDQPQERTSLKVFPNPARDVIHIALDEKVGSPDMSGSPLRFDWTKESKDAGILQKAPGKISVTNSLGVVLNELQITGGAIERGLITLNIETYQAGFYYIQIQHGDDPAATGRFLKIP